MTARTGDREQGVTLVELLIAVTILGIIMIALTGALFTGIRSTTDTQTHLQQSNAEQLLGNYLTKDVQARCIGFGTCGTQATNPTNTGTNDGTCLTTTSFDVRTIDDVSAANPTVSTITYALDGTTHELTRTTASGATSIGSGVKCMAAWRPTSGQCANEIRVDVTMLNSTEGNGTSEYPFTICAHGRAQ